MLTVHEVCEEVGVTRKTLYFYDKIGLLKPSSRSGKQNGKMYSSDEVNKLRLIIEYQNAGLTLKEIDEVVNKQNRDSLKIFLNARNRLYAQQAEINAQIQKLDALINQILTKGEK